MSEAFQKIIELSWIGTTVTVIFVVIFLLIILWIFKGNKRLYNKHAKMPLENELENKSPDKNE